MLTAPSNQPLKKASVGVH